MLPPLLMALPLTGSATVIEVEGDDVVVEAAGLRWLVSLGESLAEAVWYDLLVVLFDIVFLGDLKFVDLAVQLT
jgi:hypothetical protein